MNFSEVYFWMCSISSGVFCPVIGAMHELALREWSFNYDGIAYWQTWIVFFTDGELFPVWFNVSVIISVTSYGVSLLMRGLRVLSELIPLW